jgi:peroxiredoxin-like protein
MARKTEKKILFEVQLNWLADKRGILSAKDANGTLPVATSPELGGEGKPWAPEHLFLSAVSSCFMTTYLSFSNKLAFNMVHFECNTIGQIEVIDGKYKFTHIDLFPKIYIASEELRQKAQQALEKTHQHCLITNSINAEVFYHSEVLIDPHPRHPVENGKKATASFSLTRAKEIGDRLGIDFTRYDMNEFRKGLEVEMEHGKKIGETNITNDDEYLTAKIAWAHLHEIPDYYTRLEKMEKEAEKELAGG